MTVRSQGRVKWFRGDFSVPPRTRVLKCTPPLEGPNKEETEFSHDI